MGFTEYQIFSRPQYVWEGLDPSRVAIIPPCIDAFSAKNQPLDDGTVTSILDAAGLLPARSAAVAGFTRIDETTGRVATRAGMIEDAPLPTTAQVIAQVSRWDPLKDHVGVMTGFCDYVPPDDGIHLVLAGPDPESVADDPEGQQTLAELRAARDGLHPECRRRVHIACLPMDDVDENAAIVNALQRRADVIVQKSLAEGFGLTVAEAMWKGRPTVASRVGGIQDQIEPEVSGVLIEPSDLAGLGAAVTTLLEDEETATALGQAARARVCEEYLAPRHLERQFRLLLDVVSRG